MGIYQVQSNGKAPEGLSVGDLVVTGGGTYIITGTNSDGGYSSVMYNQAQNTYNYGGGYDSVNSSKTNTLENYYTQLAQSALENSYQPVVSSASAASAACDTLSFEDAVKMAEQVMTPQYSERYQEAAASAAQRLEKAGLYDTLYGQALSAEAENQVTQDLNTAIYTLALQLSQASEDQAMEMLSLAVKENQYGAEYNAEQRSEAISYLIKLLQMQQENELALAKVEA